MYSYRCLCILIVSLCILIAGMVLILLILLMKTQLSHKRDSEFTYSADVNPA